METQTFDRETTVDGVLRILGDMTKDWDTALNGPIGETTSLMTDLGFESIDMVMLIVAIEERFGRKGMPFESLFMIDGRYVEDVSVRELVDFLHEHLNA
jgi:acyl carrier protein